MSNSGIGDSTNAPKNLDRTKGAFPRSTSKAKKHPLAKHPLDRLDSKVSPVEIGGVLQYKLEGYWGVSPSFQGLEARKEQRCKWRAYGGKSWRCTVRPNGITDREK